MVVRVWHPSAMAPASRPERDGASEQTRNRDEGEPWSSPSARGADVAADDRCPTGSRSRRGTPSGPDPGDLPPLGQRSDRAANGSVAAPSARHRDDRARCPRSDQLPVRQRPCRRPHGVARSRPNRTRVLLTRRWTTAEERVDHHSPKVDERQGTVDERARAVDGVRTTCCGPLDLATATSCGFRLDSRSPSAYRPLVARSPDVA